MVDHDSQLGNAIGKLQDIGDEDGVWIGTLQDQARSRKSLQIRDKPRIVQLRTEIPPPEVAIADATEQRVCPQVLQLSWKLGGGWIEISDTPHHNRVFGRGTEQPVVVLNPGDCIPLRLRQQLLLAWPDRCSAVAVPAGKEQCRPGRAMGLQPAAWYRRGECACQ